MFSFGSKTFATGHKKLFLNSKSNILHENTYISTNQSGAAEAWWAHNPQVPGSKPGSDTEWLPIDFLFDKSDYIYHLM